MVTRLARAFVAAVMLGLCALTLPAQEPAGPLHVYLNPVAEGDQDQPEATDPFADDLLPADVPEMGGVCSATAAHANLCDTCDPSDGWPRPKCGVCVLPLSGCFCKAWIAQGFTGNADRPNDRFNLPVTFNDRADEYQMNQAYLAFGKELDVENRCWDWGGRVDLLYGSDYFYTQSIGLETHQDGSNKWNSEGSRFDPFGNRFAIYGLAMPQAYAEFLVPFGDATTVKLGHFYTSMGYESVMAPDNFFYSHSYTFQYGEPRTHTGVLATTEFWPSWSFQYGFTQGWDTWENPNDAYGFLGGLCFTSPDGSTSLGITVHTGNEDLGGENNRTVYSLVLMREIGCRFTYVFQHDFGIEANREINASFELDDAKWYSVNQYLYYRCRENLDFGFRVEWFRDQDNARVLGIPLQPFVTGGNYVATTFGLNWRPHKNVVLRPEIRYDLSDVDPPLGFDGMFRDFTKDSQLTIAFDLIINL